MESRELTLPQRLCQWAAEQDQYKPYLKFALFSLLLSLLAYGVLIPWLGFYWDDWPLSWNSYQFDPAVYQDFVSYRPLSGWVYFVFFSILGEKILAWHLAALLLRWLSALSLYWLLNVLWPPNRHFAVVAALVFLLYPGFSQQSISVTYSVYFLYYTLFLASLALMIVAIRTNQASLHAASLALGLCAMLCTEYFYGLELVRPLLIYLVCPQKGYKSWRAVVTRWLPYAMLLVGIFVWRHWASQQAEALYGATLIDKIVQAPAPALSEWVRHAITDTFKGGVLAWSRPISTAAGLQAGSVISLVYVPLVGLVAVVAWLFLKTMPLDETKAKATGWLGLVALVVSGLSFWVADLRLDLSFPADRFTIPMMLGASLLLASVYVWIGRWPRGRLLGIALLLGLSAGMHFAVSNQYRLEWNRQAEFARQLAWRVPSLAENTAIISPQLRGFSFNTDNSLTAMLNWMYADTARTENLHYAFFFADLRRTAGLSGLTTDGRISSGYDFVSYAGTAKDVLVLIYEPPGCLRILDPAIDMQFPQLSGEVDDLLPYSHIDLISRVPTDFETRLPYFDMQPRETWCFYFQKADLARQFGDWEEVMALGERAFALNDHPNHPAERTPFIEGYAMGGNPQRALELTQVSFEVTPLMQPMLCELWVRLGTNGVEAVSVQSAFELLGCG